MIPLAAGNALVGVLIARKLDFPVLICALIGAAFFSLTISEAVLRYDAVGAIWSAGTGMVLTMLSLIFFFAWSPGNGFARIPDKAGTDGAVGHRDFLRSAYHLSKIGASCGVCYAGRRMLPACVPDAKGHGLAWRIFPVGC